MLVLILVPFSVKGFHGIYRVLYQKIMNHGIRNPFTLMFGSYEDLVYYFAPKHGHLTSVSKRQHADQRAENSFRLQLNGLKDYVFYM